MRAESTKDFDPGAFVRPAIARLKPYSSARDEFTGTANVFLDANENGLGSPTSRSYNRYPDPYQRELKSKIAALENVGADRLFIGNGSDEAIDLLFRVFCEPRVDNVIVCPPTYGMYEVSAAVNDIEVRRAPLTEAFGLDPYAVIAESDERTKLVFICSPNNPTGNSMDRETILRIGDETGSIVVVDEAYIHFSSKESVASEIELRPNIVVLRTFSKAWGLAGLRLGIAIADPSIVSLLNKVKPPYNVSGAAQREAIEAIGEAPHVKAMIEKLLGLREELREGLEALRIVEKVFPSDANFLLVRVPDPTAVYRALIGRGIVVRDRSRVELCEGCLRITVGTGEENSALVEAIEEIGKEML
ncbi:MAG: histidinol-phosphate transaminase [Acidobacteriota bacterium]|nr:MAG: histidinol-phosphate transaminase [Acidobacteriota bacterium]